VPLGYSLVMAMWCVLVMVPIRSRVRVATVTEIGAFNAIIRGQSHPATVDYSNNIWKLESVR
jgi:hypothetical protein